MTAIAGTASQATIQTVEQLIVTKNSYLNIKTVDDNMVGFLSQIGWSSDNGDIPSKIIDFEKIFVLIDTNGGNSLFDRLHSKMQHWESVMNKVVAFLSE